MGGDIAAARSLGGNDRIGSGRSRISMTGSRCVAVDQDYLDFLLKVAANLSTPDHFGHGMAWWYRAYKKDQSASDKLLYEAAEAIAKAKRLGLWADTKAVPPWKFRRKSK